MGRAAVSHMPHRNAGPGWAMVTLVSGVCVASGMPRPAVAQPESAAPAEPELPCAVKLRRADPVFADALLTQIRDLGGCKVALDVYIVKTDGGYYLVVRDSLGRMQDRVVPSLQLAATLIASFAESSVELTPTRVTPVFDSDSPDASSEPIRSTRPTAFPTLASNRDFGRSTILAQLGRTNEAMAMQAVELHVDVGRLASSVVAAVALSLQHEAATTPVMRTDLDITSFVARRDGGWATGYLRVHSDRRVGLEPVLGLGVGILAQRRVIANYLPGYVVAYQQESALAIRMSVGVVASYALDPHVRFVVQLQAIAGAATAPGGGIDVALLGGLGLRYTP